MMIKHIPIAAAVALATLSAAAFANDLPTAGKPVEVAKSALTVTPGIDWNKLNQRPGKDSETWTLDGELLNDVSFYGGIEPDKTLFREIDKKNRPLPRFSATMLLSDLPTMLESSYRIARDVSIFEIGAVVPTQLAGRKGIHFTYSFVGPDELRRNGEADGMIVDGKLYMATYEAPALYYFDRSLPAYRALVKSFALKH
jgi:hypothetical protein